MVSFHYTFKMILEPAIKTSKAETVDQVRINILQRDYNREVEVNEKFCFSVTLLDSKLSKEAVVQSRDILSFQLLLLVINYLIITKYNTRFFQPIT